MGTTQNTAAIYVRRSAADSRDTGAHDNRSLNSQERDCRELAERHGLEVVEVYAEKVGTSASHLKNHKRPELDRAMAAVGHSYGTLIVWAIDRQTRKGMAEAGALLDLVEERGGRLLVFSDGIDSNDSSARLIIAIKAEMARQEITNTSERVKRGKAEQRARGENQGGRLPYGVVKDLNQPYGVSLNPVAVDVIRQSVDLILQGKSLGMTCKTLNDAGHRTGYNRPWTSHTLSKILRSPTLLGQRRYVGDLYRDEDGRPIQVTDPIISEADFRRVGKRLEERAALTAAMTGRGEGRKGSGGLRIVTLLASLITCGCDSPMARSGSRDSNYYYYRCAACRPGHNVNQAMVDEVVARRALAFLSTLEPDSTIMEEVSRRWLFRFAPETVGRRAEVEDEIEVLEGRRRAIQDEFYKAGTMDEFAYQSLNQDLSGRLSELRSEFVEMPDPNENLGSLLDLAGSDDAQQDPVGPGSLWASLDIDGQREVLRVLIDQVVIERRDKPRDDIEGRIKITFVTESNVTQMAQRGVSNFRTAGLTKAA